MVETVSGTVGVSCCFVVVVGSGGRGIGRVGVDSKAGTMEHGACTLASDQQVNG